MDPITKGSFRRPEVHSRKEGKKKNEKAVAIFEVLKMFTIVFAKKKTVINMYPEK